MLKRLLSFILPPVDTQARYTVYLSNGQSIEGCTLSQYLMCQAFVTEF